MGYLAYHKNSTIFGYTYADEPDRLVRQLADYETTKEAKTVLITISNTLGVEYNVYLLETFVKDKEENKEVELYEI